MKFYYNIDIKPQSICQYTC